MYKRIFDSQEKLEWLELNKPFGSIVGVTKQGDAFVIEGDRHDKRAIDDFVSKYSDEE